MGPLTPGLVTPGLVTAGLVTDGSGAVLTDLAIRVGLVLIFLIAITVVAEIADAAGVFDVAGHWAARAGHGRAWLLWLLIVALVLLDHRSQPRHHSGAADPGGDRGRPSAAVEPAPFAMTTVWLANTASLLLPVSNLTNLLGAAPVLGAGTRLPGIRLAGSVVCDGCHRGDRCRSGPHPSATCEGTTAPRLPRHLMTGPCSSWPHPCAWRSARLSSVGSPQPFRRRSRHSPWSAPAWCETVLSCARSRCPGSSSWGSAPYLSWWTSRWVMASARCSPAGWARAPVPQTCYASAQSVLALPTWQTTCRPIWLWSP